MTCSKLCLFTNTRYSTQGMFTFYSAEIATANRLFLGSNSPKPLRTNTSDPRASSASAPERASKRRKSEVENSPTFPKRQQLSSTSAILSYENDTQRVARRVIGRRNSASVIRVEYAENLTNSTESVIRGERSALKYPFLFNFSTFSNQSNERRIFRVVKNVPLETTQLIGDKSRKVALICCTFPPEHNENQTNQPKR